MIQDAAPRWKHARAVAEHFMVDQWSRSESTPTATLPLAVITYRGLDHPGSLAFAMNTLLLRTVRQKSPPPPSTFRATYMSAYECHDESFALFSCYGVLEEAAKMAIGTDTIVEIVIQPVTHEERWRDYIRALVAHLNRGMSSNQFSFHDEVTPAGRRLMVKTATSVANAPVREAAHSRGV
jgi:hypothetical protein